MLYRVIQLLLRVATNDPDQKNRFLRPEMIGKNLGLRKMFTL